MLPFSIPSGLRLDPVSQQIVWDVHAMFDSTSFVVATVWLIALPFGLAVGGAACLQQLALRTILARTEKLPWNLIRVLENATERILLQRVGGGYIFQHRLLQDYFANVQFTDTEREQR